MKTKRKIAAILLTVSLVFSCSVPSALAADDHIHDDTCGYSDGQCIYELDETDEAGADEKTGDEDESGQENDSDEEIKAGDSAADADESGEAAASLDSDTNDDSVLEGASDSGSGAIEEGTGEGSSEVSDTEEESAAESLALTASMSIASAKAPTPTVIISEVTTSSITVTEPDLYYQDVYGMAEYGIARYGSDTITWQSDNVFNYLLAGTSYTIYIRYLGNPDYDVSEAGSTTVATADATYTVTIPSTVTAGGDPVYITIDEDNLDLGLWGQVEVSVTFGLNVDGTVGLIREGDLSSEVTSQMYVNDVAVTSEFCKVATFKAGSTSAVEIRFGEPKEETILAGKYSRQVQFTITFSQ